MSKQILIPEVFKEVLTDFTIEETEETLQNHGVFEQLLESDFNHLRKQTNYHEYLLHYNAYPPLSVDMRGLVTKPIVVKPSLEDVQAVVNYLPFPEDMSLIKNVLPDGNYIMRSSLTLGETLLFLTTLKTIRDNKKGSINRLLTSEVLDTFEYPIQVFFIRRFSIYKLLTIA